MVFCTVDVYRVEYRQCPLDDRGHALDQARIPSSRFALSSGPDRKDYESTGNVTNICTIGLTCCL